MDEAGCWLFGVVVGLVLGAVWIGSHDDVVVVSKTNGIETARWNDKLYKLVPVEIKTTAEIVE